MNATKKRLEKMQNVEKMRKQETGLVKKTKIDVTNLCYIQSFKNLIINFYFQKARLQKKIATSTSPSLNPTPTQSPALSPNISPTHQPTSPSSSSQ